MVAEILLTPRELIFMAFYLDADEFYGIGDPFIGMSEKETQAEFSQAQSSIADKG
ncbi:MAG: hypothetical protein LBD23_08375 [Oscillospiraceae bacterium]|jgi:hypothetical protein|nr:hypothetical protein [Oscillospiraceae bacterium]